MKLMTQHRVNFHLQDVFPHSIRPWARKKEFYLTPPFQSAIFIYLIPPRNIRSRKVEAEEVSYFVMTVKLTAVSYYTHRAQKYTHEEEEEHQSQNGIIFFVHRTAYSRIKIWKGNRRTKSFAYYRYGISLAMSEKVILYSFSKLVKLFSFEAFIKNGDILRFSYVFSWKIFPTLSSTFVRGYEMNIWRSRKT